MTNHIKTSCRLYICPCQGQNPLHQFPRSKSVTSWQLPVYGEVTGKLVVFLGITHLKRKIFFHSATPSPAGYAHGVKHIATHGNHCTFVIFSVKFANKYDVKTLLCVISVSSVSFVTQHSSLKYSQNTNTYITNAIK